MRWKKHLLEHIIHAEINPKTEIYSEYGTEKVKYRRKSPVLAALLSCIIPGLGQVYAGDPLRGFAIIAALGISFCLMALLLEFLHSSVP